MVLSALRGSSGKTLLALGLLRAWRNLGRSVAPFKKGPDYIDPAWHSLAAGRECRNLDTFLMGRDGAAQSFIRHSEPAALTIIEGNRGIFDGVDAEGTHSTAELAKLLGAPVVLVADCSKVTRTLAAMIRGCRDFDPEIAIRGVILNQVAGGRHERILRTTVERYAGVPVLGAVPRVRDGTFPERHLGLLPPQEHPDAEAAIEAAAAIVARHVDLDRLSDIACSAPPMESPDMQADDVPAEQGDRPRVGVARDSAFGFYYPENLEALAAAGAEMVMVSPLKDRELPPLDALYIGGGFPETHAEALAANTGFRQGLMDAVEDGLPVYAECGGLMYLGERLEANGRTYPMVGALPVRFGVEEQMQGHGYTRLEVSGENPYFPVGRELAGHEFHYSRPLEWKEGAFDLVFSVKRGRGFDAKKDGLCYRNVLATYTHIHACGTPDWAPAVAARARERMGERSVVRAVS
ncbi:MAG: cobyrinate a,c-diamide synthase [Planctomycetota bacterium]